MWAAMAKSQGVDLGKIEAYRSNDQGLMESPRRCYDNLFA